MSPGELTLRLMNTGDDILAEVSRATCLHKKVHVEAINHNREWKVHEEVINHNREWRGRRERSMEAERRKRSTTMIAVANRSQGTALASQQ